MKKIKGKLDRFEGDFAVIKYNGFEFSLPREAVTVAEEDFVVITVASEEEDKQSSKEIAENLLKEVLRGE